MKSARNFTKSIKKTTNFDFHGLIWLLYFGDIPYVVLKVTANQERRLIA